MCYCHGGDGGHHATDVVRALRERRVNAAASLQWFGLLDFSERQATMGLVEGITDLAGSRATARGDVERRLEDPREWL